MLRISADTCQSGPDEERDEGCSGCHGDQAQANGASACGQQQVFPDGFGEHPGRDLQQG